MGKGKFSSVTDVFYFILIQSFYQMYKLLSIKSNRTRQLVIRLHASKEEISVIVKILEKFNYNYLKRLEML